MQHQLIPTPEFAYGKLYRLFPTHSNLCAILTYDHWLILHNITFRRNGFNSVQCVDSYLYLRWSRRILNQIYNTGKFGNSPNARHFMHFIYTYLVYASLYADRTETSNFDWLIQCALKLIVAVVPSNEGYNPHLSWATRRVFTIRTSPSLPPPLIHLKGRQHPMKSNNTSFQTSSGKLLP